MYDRLRAVMPSPIVELNRAIAYSMAFGPDAGLRLLDEIADAWALWGYAPLPAARRVGIVVDGAMFIGFWAHGHGLLRRKGSSQ